MFTRLKSNSAFQGASKILRKYGIVNESGLAGAPGLTTRGMVVAGMLGGAAGTAMLGRFSSTPTRNR